MRTLELPRDAGPRARGRAHGEAFRREIREISAIRVELAIEQGNLANEKQVLKVAQMHLPILASYDAALSEELLGIAEGADVSEARIVVLNHYTDLKDLGPEVLSMDEDCSVIAAKCADGSVALGQTWDMHGSAAPYVAMMRVPAIGERPEHWVLTITGCLGMAGMNAHGVGVCINNLKSHDARLGVVWPAIVRRMLAEREAEAAKHVLMTAPMSSGHHYLIASADRAYGVETSGALKDVVWQTDWNANDAAYLHTNHCLGETIGRVSWVSDTSTTRERFDWLARSIGERPIAGVRDVWARLGTHDGHPRSVCTHLANEREPHAMLTCAGIVMDLNAKRLFAAPGCIHDAEPVPFSFEDAS